MSTRIMKNIKVLDYDRIDVLKELMFIRQANQKIVMFVTIGIF